jgi:hypothetical protein
MYRNDADPLKNDRVLLSYTPIDERDPERKSRGANKEMIHDLSTIS